MDYVFQDKEDQMQQREEWLSEHGAKSSDVVYDEDGRELIYVEPTLMDEGEPEDGRLKKVYLPKELNSDYLL